MNPDEDEGYWDFKIVDGKFQFTIYSFDYRAAASIAVGKYVLEHEKYLVGQFRATFEPTGAELLNILDKETNSNYLYKGEHYAVCLQ